MNQIPTLKPEELGATKVMLLAAYMDRTGAKNARVEVVDSVVIGGCTVAVFRCTEVDE